CQNVPEEPGQTVGQQIKSEEQEHVSGNCRPADVMRARKTCEAVLKAPIWANCASHVVLRPFLLGCTINLSLECPTHSIYTNCLPSCSPSCWDLNGQCTGARVPSTCTEGCICQPGYVLKEDKCVPRSQCSCKDDQGSLIPAGKTWISSGCTQSCTCVGGTIQCQAFRCPSGSHCQLSSNGNSNCAPNHLVPCLVFGDPHYRTFDGLSYRFQGRMTYILIKTVDELPSGLERLLVEGRNKLNPPVSPVFLHEVITTVYGYKVQLQAGLGLVVNNQRMAIPYRPNEHLQVTLQSQRLFLVTDFELAVSFDGRSSLGDSFVNEDCSQRCTCTSLGILLCEPHRCSTGETCTLGNLTRGCFRESPCLQNPCKNDGRCQEQGDSFNCKCELGYGGHLCTEPWDVLPVRKPEASNFGAILLGMLLPMTVIVLAATRGCIHRMKRRRKMEKVQSQNRARLEDTGEEHPTAQNLEGQVECAPDMGFLPSLHVVPEHAFRVAQS
ncbi:PREDICTED: zonadhesin-like, partial [Galeopterus variegatus]|uniref:Zonadhesin-like n=1 Tax=Galeopterus variegatus TaxID=482537 RepID=A0ABM0SF45_GALVR